MIPFKRLLWACEYFIWWYCHSQISDFGVIKWKRFPPSNLYWLPIQEMASLSVNTRKEMLNSTYPALYVVMFSILEGNTRYKNTNTEPNTNMKNLFVLQSDWTLNKHHHRESSWIDQHKKTIHITKENHRSVQGYIAGLENVSQLIFTMYLASQTRRSTTCKNILLLEEKQFCVEYHQIEFAKNMER